MPISFSILFLLLLLTGCKTDRPRVVPSDSDLEHVASSEPDLQHSIGQRVTLRGRFELAGKIGPYIHRTGEPVYLVPAKLPFSWGSEYQRMQGKIVNITGTLHFRHFERNAAVPPFVA